MFRFLAYAPLIGAAVLTGCGPRPLPIGEVETVSTASLPDPGEVRIVSVTRIPDEILAVSSESFSGDPASWKWRIPYPAMAVKERGIAYVTEKGGPGPRYVGPPLEVSAVTAVRVRISASSFKSDDERAAIPWVGFYWARSEDTAAGDWPFSNERRVELHKALEDPDDPTWIGRLEGHPLWNGQLEGAFVATNFAKDPAFEDSDDGSLKYFVAVQSVDLVRTMPMKNWRP